MTESRHQLSRFAAIFAGGTLISRVLGLARDIAINACIPLAVRDAFWAAFRFPNMLRDIVGEGASNAAFMPVLSEAMEKQGEQEFRRLTSALMSAVAVVLGVVSVLGVLFAPELFNLGGWVERFTHSAPRNQVDMDLTVSLTRWIFPYIFLIGLTVFQMGPLFVLKHYSTPSWSPALLNVFMIVACLGPFRALFPSSGYALVAGVWAGGIAQFAVQYLALGRRTGVWFPSFELRHPGIRQALYLWIPVVLGQATGEINKVIDMLFVVSMGEGLITAFQNANRIVQLPLAMFGVAISAAILPSVSRAAARADKAEVRSTVMHGLRQSFFLTSPAIVMLLVVPRLTVATLFERGQFTPAQTDTTAVILAYFAWGLLCFAWVKVAVTGFYAFRDTKTPVIIASLSMALNVLLIFCLARPMGYRGLALATTISYFANFVGLYVLLSRRLGLLWDRALGVSLLKATGSSVVMAVIVYACYRSCENVLAMTTLWPRAFGLVLCGMAGAGTYAFCAWLLRIPDFEIFAAMLRRRRAA